MTNEMLDYKEAIALALEHASLNVYDSKWIASSNMDDAYRLQHWFKERINFLHKSVGHSWIVGTVDGKFFRIAFDKNNQITNIGGK